MNGIEPIITATGGTHAKVCEATMRRIRAGIEHHIRPLADGSVGDHPSVGNVEPKG